MSTEHEFEKINQRVDYLEKGVETNRWYIGGFSGLVSFIFGVVAIIGGLTFSGELDRLARTEEKLIKQVEASQAELKAFKAEMVTSLDKELGKLKSTPQLSLRTTSLDTLAGSTLKVPTEVREDGFTYLFVTIAIVNTGDARSGLMDIKIYASNGLTLTFNSAEEPGYSTQEVIGNEDLAPNNIPGGGCSLPYEFSFGIRGQQTATPGIYKMKVKVFYGGGQVEESEFAVEIE